MKLPSAKWFQEKTHPYVFALAAAWAFRFVPTSMRVDVATLLSSQVVTVVSVFVGFMAASLAIILTAPDHRGIRRLRTSPEQFGYLIRYHTEAIRVGIVAAAFSFAVMVVCKTLGPTDVPSLFVKMWLLRLWVFSFVAALFLFLRVVNLMQKLLLQTETQ